MEGTLLMEHRAPGRFAERTLVQRMVAGDETALAELYDGYSGFVFGLALRVLGNRARAETRLTANLPAWNLDATTTVFLDEDPQQPYLIVVNKGPLDDPNVAISRGNARAQNEPAQQQPAQQQPSQMQEQPPQQQQPTKNKKPTFKDLLKKF